MDLRVWVVYIARKLWISDAYIPGAEEADKQSQVFQLHPILFKKITDHFGKPEIDLLASCVNKKIEKYALWYPEPDAIAINAFYVKWSDTNFYIFQPLSIKSQMLAKALRNKKNAAIVVPNWNTQYWYPQLMQMTEGSEIFFEPDQTNLLLPHKSN